MLVIRIDETDLKKEPEEQSNMAHSREISGQNQRNAFDRSPNIEEYARKKRKSSE